MRKIGALLGYKQAVVLSHMITGRVPIPVERAEEIAAILQMDPAAFLSAVVKQRHPSVNWSLLAGHDASEGAEISHELAVSLGRPLRELNQEQRAVMREVAADPRPRRRWLSVHELVAVEAIRETRRKVPSEELTLSDLSTIRSALRRSSDPECPPKS